MPQTIALMGNLFQDATCIEVIEKQQIKAHSTLPNRMDLRRFTRTRHSDGFDKGFDKIACQFVGAEELPQVAPFTQAVPLRLVPFTLRKQDSILSTPHFYEHDRAFESVWRNPAKYASILKNYPSVIAPDWSQYCDMPKFFNLYNLYRNRIITAYWQQEGLQVIPSVSWSDVDSFAYCFDGLPQNSLLAVGSIGVSHCPASLRLWRIAVSNILERLHPIGLLIYGTHIEFDNPQQVPVYYFQDFIHTRLRK